MQMKWLILHLGWMHLWITQRVFLAILILYLYYIPNKFVGCGINKTMVWFKPRIQVSYNYCGSVSIFIILMFHLVLDTCLPPCHRHTPDIVLGPFTTISCLSNKYFCRQTYSINPKDKSIIVRRMLVPDTKILQPKKNLHLCLIGISWPQKQVEDFMKSYS